MSAVPSRPDPEARSPRRTYAPRYKLEILAETDGAECKRAVGGILRREGLYSSLISEWPKQRDRDALAFGNQPTVAGRVHRQVALGQHLSGRLDDAHIVSIGSPIDPNGRRHGRCRVIPHGCLIAAAPVGIHPVVPGRARRSLIDRRSVALSPAAAWHVVGHRAPRISCWASTGKQARGWSGGHQGGISSQAADTRKDAQ